jgi:O-antigen/teichoic acid export membrane protein
LKILQPARLKKLALYGFGALAPAATGLLVLPLYARSLSVSGFGAVVLVTTAYSLFSAITLLGLNSALVREYHEAEPEARRELIGAITVAVLGTSLVAAALVVLIAVGFPGFGRFALGDDRFQVALLAGGYFIAQNAFVLQQAAARASTDAARFALLAAVQSFLLAALSVLLVGLLRLEVTGFLLASMLAALGGAIVGWISPQDRPRITRRWRSLLPGALAYGLPLIVVNVSGWALWLIDRYLVNSLLGLEATGLYGLATRLGSVASLLVLVPLSTLFPPYLFKRKAADGFDSAVGLVRRVHSGIVAGVAAIALVLTLTAEPLLRLVGGPEYVVAAPALGWIAWGTVGYASVQVLGNYHALVRRTGVVATLTVIAAAIKVAAAIVLLPRMGIVGAGVASFVSHAVLALGMGLTGYWLTRRNETAPAPMASPQP